MDEQDQPVLIMVTAGGRNDAERLGEDLVVERLAASCSVVPTIHSFYYSEGLLKREHEALLMIRTLRSKIAAVREYIGAHHSYELPEIIDIAIDGGSPAYLRWLAGEVAEPRPEH